MENQFAARRRGPKK